MKDDDKTMEYEFQHQQVGQRARFRTPIQGQWRLNVENIASALADCVVSIIAAFVNYLDPSPRLLFVVDHFRFARDPPRTSTSTGSRRHSREIFNPIRFPALATIRRKRLFSME